MLTLEAGFLGGRGDAGDQPGVSRRESRWSATSREGGAPSRERRRNSPCGSRAARGNLPVRASIERASSRVPFHMGASTVLLFSGFSRLKKWGEWKYHLFICGFSRLRTLSQKSYAVTVTNVRLSLQISVSF
jgi:hypothetical protein